MDHLIVTTLIRDTATTNFKDVVLGRITKLIDLYVEKQWEYQTTDVKEKLKEMASSFTKIKAVVDVAERKEIDKEDRSLLEWLTELKNAIYDAEYVMDIFEYKRLKNEMGESTQEVVKKGKVSNFLKLSLACCSKFPKSASVVVKRLFFADEELNDLLQLVTKLNSLVAAINSISFLLNSYRDSADQVRGVAAVGAPNPRESTSALVEDKLFGRDEVEKELLNKLLQSSDGSSSQTKNFSVVSVIGVGGVGKTALAQSVFNHQRVKDYFNLKAWVFVSTNFNSKSLMVHIVDSAKIEKTGDFHSLTDLESVQEVLKEGLKSGKFLIVLDDVWEDMEQKWEQISAPFCQEEKGSKILVTSRSRQVTKFMGAQDNMQIDLKPLESEPFLEFFQKFAFGNKKLEEYPPDLKKISLKIAKRLGGLPLAAKTVGAALRRDLNVDHWKSVLDNEGWKKQKNGSIMSALKLSYDYLPKHLKKCFVYSSLFPKGYQYDAETLVDIWISLDCVRHEGKDKRLVDINRECILQLVGGCFLQSEGSYYVMHDLLHDLAEQIAGHEVYRVEDDASLSKKILQPHCIRHLYVKSTKHDALNLVLQNLDIAPTQLQSLVYVGEGEITIFKETIPKLKGLRLLFLSGGKKMELGEKIGDLIHLRCINLDFSSFSSANTFIFPTSFWKLHLLEIVRWKYVEKIRKCSGLQKLTNLRYFEQHGQHYDPEIITSHLSRLKLLEVVPGGKFIVDGKMENDIGQLGELNEIGGELTLKVRIKLSDQEATKANLKEKKYLTGLTIYEECKNEDGGIEENTLAALRPHENLQNLKIEQCKLITKSPDWLSDLSILTILHLLNLPNLQRLPPDLGYSLEALKELHLRGLPLVKQIDVGGATSSELFPSLVLIEMHDMINLEGWSFHRCNQTTKFFPKISKIDIQNCPKLLIKGEITNCQIFPSPQPNCDIRLMFDNAPTYLSFSSAENMKNMIEMKIDEQSLSPVTDDNNEPKTSQLLKFIKEMIILELPVNIMINLFPAALSQKFPSLELLQIAGCNSLESLGQGVALHRPNSIKKLIIKSCRNLKFLLADNGLQTLSSLETLIIRDCFELQSLTSTNDDNELVSLPPSINKVIISICPKLKLPGATIQMLNSSSIHTLIIDNCGEIEKSVQHRGTRSRFKVDGEDKENDVGQLQWMNGIRGELTLKVHVKLSEKEARQTNLNWKRQVSKLIIKENEDGRVEAEAMEALQPNEGLDKLKIDGCKMLKTTPTWLPMLCYLTEVELYNLPNLQEIPSHLGYQLLKLEKLNLISLPSVKKIHVTAPVDSRQELKLFPSLVHVKMSEMINLEGWSLVSYNNQTTEKLTKLETIEIYNCPKLLKECDSPNCIIFPLPSSNCNVRLVLYPNDHYDDEVNDNDNEEEEDLLRMIGMKIDTQSLVPIANDNNNSKTSILLNCTKEIGVVQVQNHMELLQVLFHKVSSLEGLIIDNCNESELFENIFHHHLPAASRINKLVIRFCFKLKFLSAANIFPSLETLIIEDCKELQSLTFDNGNQLLFFLHSVKKLIVKRCPRLNFLFLRQLSSLEKLTIEDCMEIWSMINDKFPASASVKTLTIKRYPRLNFLFLRRLPSLEKLTIEDCMEIESLTNDDDRSLSVSIKTLIIKGFPRLNIPFLRLLTSLEKLTIEDCKEIESLTNDDQLLLFLPSIKKIIIRGCGRVKFPADTIHMLISHIDMLIIEDCESVHPRSWTDREEQNGMGKLDHSNQLQFIEGKNGCIEQKVIEAFKAHENIEKLKISKCKHITMPPNWLCKHSNLTTLFLFDLQKLQLIPPDLGVHLKSLKYLHLISLPSLKHIHLNASSVSVSSPMSALQLLPSLIYVKMHDMINFKGWSLDKPITNQLKIRNFPQLYKIDIHKCPMLLVDGDSLLPLPSPNSNIRLTLYPDGDIEYNDDDEVNVERKTWMIDMHIDRKSVVTASKPLNCVKEMVIKSNIQHMKDMMKSSPTAPQIFSSLKVLELDDCDDFESIDHLPAVSCIKTLFIKRCDKLKILSVANNLQIFSSLESVIIEDCDKIESLSDSNSDESTFLHASVKTLEIRKCPKLMFQSLRLPSSLEKLVIAECDKLESLAARNSPHSDENTLLPTKVKRLSILKCPRLMFLSLQPLPLLEMIIIEDCEELQSLTNQHSDDNTNNELMLLPPSIKFLIIKGCNKLKLPAATLQLLSSIRYVEIEDCRQIEESHHTQQQ